MGGRREVRSGKGEGEEKEEEQGGGLEHILDEFISEPQLNTQSSSAAAWFPMSPWGRGRRLCHTKNSRS